MFLIWSFYTFAFSGRDLTILQKLGTWKIVYETGELNMVGLNVGDCCGLTRTKWTCYRDYSGLISFSS